MRIVCYGDSNTYGFDPREGTSGRLPKEERWTGILDEMPEFEIVNEGLNGRMIPDEDASYKNLGRIIRRNSGADALLIMLGTNDMFMMRGATAVRLGKKMAAVFENVPELREFRSLPDKHIVLVCPPAPSDKVLFFRMIGIRDSQTTAEIAKIMKELPGEYAKVAAAEKIDFMDAGKWDIDLSYDGVHFSEAGHRKFAAGVREEMKRLNLF